MKQRYVTNFSLKGLLIVSFILTVQTFREYLKLFLLTLGNFLLSLNVFFLVRLLFLRQKLLNILPVCIDSLLLTTSFQL